MKRFPCIFSILILLTFSEIVRVSAQEYLEDYSFFRSQAPPVIHHNDTLTHPWAGGINAAHFSEIDLDQDGFNDLFAFEKHGNRVLTFLRRGDHYLYAPEYAKSFPELHDWAVIHDYNFDGKPDIFTYGLAGIRVFKNISSSQLDFQLVTEQLQAYYYNGYVNIFASPDDYLIIDDIDEDGHLDILNFWVLGKYVHHLRNYSDDPEVFDFHLESECWGHFEEAADNNIISLYSDCNSKNEAYGEHTRHTGSSMLLYDFDHNGLKDILLGDIDYPNLILLYNYGTVQEARMTEQDTAFPAGAPVHLYSMPAPALIQLPGQAAPSLIISPSDPSLNKSQDHQCVWRYDYDTLLQSYTLVDSAFLQKEMIDIGSGCRPVLFDWDNDGLQDLFIANYGSFDSARLINGFLTSYYASSIQYYKNTGSAIQPAFQLQNTDFGNLKSLNYKSLHPAFYDFNGDGQTDMLCGQEDGTLLFVPHQRLITGSGDITGNFLNIDAGKYSTPTLFDLDGDGNADLIIGNQRGLLSYYRNDGGNFIWVTDTLGGVDVRDFEQYYFGYSVPCFYRDSQNGTVLFCGSEQGNIFYYKDIDQNLNGQFTLEGTLWESADAACSYCSSALREGRRVGVAIANLDGDAYPDLLVGNYAGGVTYFYGRTPASHHSDVPIEVQTPFRLYPNPTNGLIFVEGETPVTSLELYDIMGKVLLHGNDPSLDLQALPDGIYILNINRQTRLKVIKSSK